MPYFLAAFLLLWLILYGMRAFTRANPAAVARLIRRGGGLGALALAFFLLVRGRFDIALGLASLGLWLLNWRQGQPWGAIGKMWSAGQKSGQSRIRSAMVEMELDHESGAMRGHILAGPHEGKSLDELTRPECQALYDMCQLDDPDGARLLEAYLDRRFARWRTAGEGQGDAGQGGAGARGSRSAMSEDEAYEVLGLQKGASRDDVARAHRALMKKLHPDHGGSTNLAARVNEAKDLLMRRQR